MEKEEEGSTTFKLGHHHTLLIFVIALAQNASLAIALGVNFFEIYAYAIVSPSKHFTQHFDDKALEY